MTNTIQKWRPDSSACPQTLFSGPHVCHTHCQGRHIRARLYQADQIVILEDVPCEGLGQVNTGRPKAVRLAAGGVFADAPNPVTIIAVPR